MSKASSEGKKPAAKSASLVDKTKRRHRQVLVVTCPSDFPVESGQRNGATEQSRGKEGDHRRKKQKLDPQILDWNEASREVKSLGATAFVGASKRQYREEEYFRLTEKKLKHHHVPPNIRRGIQKKVAQRAIRQRDEAREAGLVLPKTSTARKQRNRDRGVGGETGPEPSVGYMSKGILRVKKER